MDKTTKSRRLKVGGYDVAWTTRDGVRILEPVTRPTHFTRDEIRASVRKVLAEQRKQAVANES